MVILRTVVDIWRHEESSEYGTFGITLIDNQAFCVSLELPDHENAVNISSIPAQQYTCLRVNSPTFGTTFKVMDVPGRSDILIHPANLVDDLEGCLAFAQHFGKLRGNRGVLNSGKTFRKFMRIMSGQIGFQLTIHEAY